MDTKDKLIQELQEQLQKSSEIAQKAVDYLKEYEKREQALVKRESELKTWDVIKKPESQVDIKNAADILKLPYKGKRTLGQNLLFEFLRDCNILSGHTSNWNEPYHQYIPIYFNITEARIEHLEKTFTKTIVTQEGLDFIRQLYEERGDEWILSR